MMRNKSIIFFLTTISIVSLIILLILFNYNSELEKRISHKNNLISKFSERDSVLDKKTEQYAKTIEKYVNNCEFSINGKKISPSEVVKLTNKTLTENQKLEDSLRYYKMISSEQLKTYQEVYEEEYNKIINQYIDSLAVFKWKAELVKKDFGITYEIERNGDKLISTRSSEKVDSALALFPYYKHKLSIDENGNFVIETDREYRKKVKKEDKSKE